MSLTSRMLLQHRILHIEVHIKQVEIGESREDPAQEGDGVVEVDVLEYVAVVT